MLRVFISSTSQDLAAHRAALQEALIKMGLDPVMQEHLPVIDENEVAACKKLVESCDLFVGVYAHRYGFIPTGYTKSITELEYEWAIAKNIPIRVFGVDPNYEWPTHHREIFYPNLLARFKARVAGNQHIKGTFTTPETLMVVVVKSLANAVPHSTYHPKPPRQLNFNGWLLGGVAAIVFGCAICGLILTVRGDDEDETSDQEQLNTSIAIFLDTDPFAMPTVAPFRFRPTEARPPDEFDHALLLEFNNRRNAYDDLIATDIAVEELTQAIERNPNDARLYNARGLIYANVERSVFALRDYNQAIELDPEFVDAFANRGVVHMLRGDYQLAIDDFTQVVRLTPSAADGYGLRGLAYYVHGRSTSALFDLQEYRERVGGNGNHLFLDPLATLERPFITPSPTAGPAFVTNPRYPSGTKLILPGFAIFTRAEPASFRQGVVCSGGTEVTVGATMLAGDGKRWVEINCGDWGWIEESELPAP